VLLLFGVSEVPLEDEALPLRIAVHALTVPAELRVVRGQQLETGQGALSELIDEPAVAEHTAHLPVGRDGTQVDDLHVPLRWELFQLLFVDCHWPHPTGRPQ